MIPLTDEQKEILINTPDDQLKMVFPNNKRSELRAWKRELRKNVEVIINAFERQDKIQSLEKTIEELIKENKRINNEKNLILKFKSTPQEYKIKQIKSNKREATHFIVASDWHIEERVDKEKTNGLNEFNLEIAEQRINKFFINALRLIKLKEKDIIITNKVLALLGDFISGNIHEELLENTELRPSEAIVWVHKRIKAGIEFLLNNTKGNWTIVAHIGNHSRNTKKIHTSTEAGNSSEYIMYQFLKNEIQDKRVKWLVAEGYHSYLDLYGYKVRLHHGHSIRYMGGIGGFTIPANKKVQAWNKAIPAQLDVFGHLHRLFNGGDFIVNGSLIGYNPYGLVKGYPKEKPQQKSFMFTSKGEVTGEDIIFLE